MYYKVKQKRIKAQPTREEIEEHMIRYRQLKMDHMEQERGFAEARKKDWKRKNSELRKIGAGVASPLKHKVDFVEEQKLREKEEEELHRLRIERGKEYGDAVRGGADLPPSPRSTDKPHTHLHPRRLSSELAVRVDSTPSPKRQQHKNSPDKHNKRSGSVAGLDVVALAPTSPRNHKGGSPRAASVGKKEKEVGQQLSPSLLGQNGHAPGHVGGNPVKEPPSDKKDAKLRRSLTSQASVVDGDPGSPYDGLVGPEWVCEVMDEDGEEGNLAVVYETGFSMLMAEKGIINSGDLYDDLALVDGMVVATPPVKDGRLMVPSPLMVTEPTTD